MLLLLKHQGCTEGDVRLLEGSTSLEGRVEVCRSNAWGTVCHSGWTVEDARVVCRQLGYSVVGTSCYAIYVSIGDHKFPHCAGAIARTGSFYGPGTGPIARGSVACRGYEARLPDCSASAPVRCTHAHDAGVRCMLQTGWLAT